MCPRLRLPCHVAAAGRPVDNGVDPFDRSKLVAYRSSIERHTFQCLYLLGIGQISSPTTLSSIAVVLVLGIEQAGQEA